jgi:hypothetical protein
MEKSVSNATKVGGIAAFAICMPVPHAKPPSFDFFSASHAVAIYSDAIPSF